MPENIGYQFNRLYASPIETYRQVNTISQRNSIPPEIRWEGMECYVVSENQDYQLVGGIDNSNWVNAGETVSNPTTHFKGFFNATTVTPAISNLNGIEGDEYKVTNGGVNVDFGAGDVFLETDDIIIFYQSQWRLKVRVGGNTDTPFVTPEEYGAIGDGTTDDHEAIQEAINSGYPVKLFPKNYYISTALQFPNKSSLSGYGIKSIIKTDGDYNAIEIVGNDVSISRIGMLGSGKTSGFTNNNAIFLQGNAPTNQRTTIMLSNIYIDNFGNAGFLQIGRTSTTYQASTLFDNVSITACQIGYDLAERGEYNSFINIVAHDNVIGVRMAGGNNNFVGGQITNNVDGVSLIAGSNDGHSVMSGIMINHNTSNAIKTSGIVNGYLFDSCMMYYGDIEIINSQKIKFVNCDIDIDEVKSANSTNIEFDSNKWLTTPTFTDDYLSGGVSEIRFFNENFIEGGEPSYIKSSILGDLTTTGNIMAQGTVRGASNSGINGTDSGDSNQAFFAFYESNGTTEQGYIGFPSSGNSNLYLRNTVSDKQIILSDTGDLTYNGNIVGSKYLLSALNTAPATSTSTGTAGEIRFTATHIYVCTATNTWVRAALATW